MMERGMWNDIWVADVVTEKINAFDSVGTFELNGPRKLIEWLVHWLSDCGFTVYFIYISDYDCSMRVSW